MKAESILDLIEFSLAKSGCFVVGLNSKAYLASFTSGRLGTDDANALIAKQNATNLTKAFINSWNSWRFVFEVKSSQLSLWPE